METTEAPAPRGKRGIGVVVGLVVLLLILVSVGEEVGLHQSHKNSPTLHHSINE